MTDKQARMLHIAQLAGISTGIEAIDAGHRALLRSLNELEWAIASRSSKEIVLQFFVTLGEQSIRHFAQEEELLERSGYPSLDEHRAEHAALIRRLERYAAAFAGGEYTFAEALSFLKKWAADHLVHYDAHYFPYLLNAGERTPSLSEGDQ